jgi:hypothetical protein
LGVGRAKLTDLTSSTKEDHNNNNNHNYGVMGSMSSADDTDIDNEPILMASMKLVLDGSTKRNGKCTQHASPIHALNEVSMWTSRIGFLHKDRQKLVQGLQAAQARLNGASEEWQDWDGIGDLFSEDGPNNDSVDETLQAFLAMTPDDASFDINNNLESSVPLSAESLRVSKLDNYGMGMTPSAYSDLQALSEVLKKQLEPYYSPSRAESEEFDYCMVSWVALQSLQAYLPQHREIKDILEYSNTVERMEQLYDNMMAHKRALQELAQAKSRELRDCGEECTDLF